MNRSMCVTWRKGRQARKDRPQVLCAGVWSGEVCWAGPTWAEIQQRIPEARHGEKGYVTTQLEWVPMDIAAQVAWEARQLHKPMALLTPDMWESMRHHNQRLFRKEDL